MSYCFPPDICQFLLPSSNTNFLNDMSFQKCKWSWVSKLHFFFLLTVNCYDFLWKIVERFTSAVFSFELWVILKNQLPLKSHPLLPSEHKLCSLIILDKEFSKFLKNLDSIKDTAQIKSVVGIKNLEISPIFAKLFNQEMLH